jgi:hypothetical protein
MSILKEIKNSLSNPDYYRDLIDVPFGKSLKYYAALVMLISIIVTIVGSALIIPIFNRLAFSLKETVLSSYPDDLQISIDKGTVKTNVPEPYTFSVPSAYQSEALNTKNLLVIDTASEGSPETLESYDTLVLLAKDRVVYKENPSANGGVIIRILDKNMNLVLNKLSVSKFFTSIEPYYKYITPIIVLGIFMGVVLVMLGAMLYLLFIALIVWLVAMLNNWKISYLKAYQLSLHFATIGFIVAWLGVILFPGGALFVLLVATIILLALVTFTTTQISKKV